MLISSMVLVSAGAATSQRYVAVSIRVVFLITSDVLLRISARVTKSPEAQERDRDVSGQPHRLVSGSELSGSTWSLEKHLKGT